VFTLGEALNEETEGVLEAVREASVKPGRCLVEDSDGRFVFQNFRRASSGQPRRVVLG
jgi:hypothetical protein